jgi:hypothetical protein
MLVVVDTAELIVELVKALAWPIAVVALVILLRPFLANRLTDIEAFGVRARFRELVEEAERSADQTPGSDDETATGAQASELVGVDEDLYSVAEREPASAILAAYERVVKQLGQRLAQDGVEGPTSASAIQLARVARDREIIDEPTADAIRSMAELRNLVAHGRKKIRSSEAVDYLAAADNVLYSLSRRGARSTTRFTVTEDGSVLGERLPASAAFRVIADAVVRDVGVERVLNAVGPPRLASRSLALTVRAKSHPTWISGTPRSSTSATFSTWRRSSPHSPTVCSV